MLDQNKREGSIRRRNVERKKKGQGGRDAESSGDGAPEPEYIEKVLTINRVSKVVKGGKRMSFSALVVVGDGKGKVGYALGKANEVAEAIKKGIAIARRSMVDIPMKGATIPHEYIGHFGAAKIILKPAGPGTGVIAGAPARAIFEAAGIHDILTKCLKTNNPVNVVKATMAGLQDMKRIVAAQRYRQETVLKGK